jgi:hypothetical protein
MHYMSVFNMHGTLELDLLPVIVLLIVILHVLSDFIVLIFVTNGGGRNRSQNVLNGFDNKERREFRAMPTNHLRSGGKSYPEKPCELYIILQKMDSV